MAIPELTLLVVDGTFARCRLGGNAPIPPPSKPQEVIAFFVSDVKMRPVVRHISVMPLAAS